MLEFNYKINCFAHFDYPARFDESTESMQADELVLDHWDAGNTPRFSDFDFAWIAIDETKRALMRMING